MKKISSFCMHVVKFSGNPWAFVLAFLLVVIWAAVGPFLHFSAVWQLSINTGTTIITFLMVFSIQHSQNKDTAELHGKIDELLRKLEEKDKNPIK